LGLDQINPDYYTSVVTAINAGLDMVMVPYDLKRFVETMHKAVQNGDISQARIDDAVRRILRVKFSLGIFEQPFTDDALLAEVGKDEHREIAREAVRKSMVLLKNENQIMPLKKTIGQIIVAGQAANDIGLQCGGWTIEWMGKPGEITEGTTILEGIRQTVSGDTEITYSPSAEFGDQIQAEIGILVLAEQPYAEGKGDRLELVLSPEDIAVSKRLKQHCSKVVAILLSGRPIIITPQLEDWDVFIAGGLPGTEGQGVADVLFGDYPFTGKLSFAWPRSMDQVPLSVLEQDGQSPLWPIHLVWSPER